MDLRTNEEYFKVWCGNHQFLMAKCLFSLKQLNLILPLSIDVIVVRFLPLVKMVLMNLYVTKPWLRNALFGIAHGFRYGLTKL